MDTPAKAFWVSHCGACVCTNRPLSVLCQKKMPSYTWLSGALHHQTELELVETLGFFIFFFFGRDNLLTFSSLLFYVEVGGGELGCQPFQRREMKFIRPSAHTFTTREKKSTSFRKLWFPFQCLKSHPLEPPSLFFFFFFFQTLQIWEIVNGFYPSSILSPSWAAPFHYNSSNSPPLLLLLIFLSVASFYHFNSTHGGFVCVAV